MTTLSICVTVKNRSRVRVADHELRLFPDCIESIARATSRQTPVELVVADWESDDWPLNEWLPQAIADTPTRLISMTGTFSRGRGLNAAARASDGALLFFLDADMLVSPQ